MPDLASDVTALRSLADRVQGLREAAVRRLTATQREIKRLENEEETCGLVADLFRTLIDQEITQGVKAAEKLLTEGLQAAFPDMDLTVRADIEILRGKVSVDLVTVERKPDGIVVEGLPTDSFGGSVLALESVLLRLMVAMKRGLRLVLLLDETLPAFNDTYAVAVGGFLSEFCGRVGLNIGLISHSPPLIETCNRAYRIVRHGSVARFEVTR